MNSTQALVKLVKKELARHTSLRKVEGLEEVMAILWTISGIKKIKALETLPEGSSMRTLRLHQDPESSDCLIAVFNATNASAKLVLALEKDTDVLDLLKKIEKEMSRRKCVARIILDKQFQENLEEGEKIKMKIDSEWYIGKEKEKREQESKGVLKEKYYKAYLLLYRASDEISEDGEYFIVKGAYSLLREEFGEIEGKKYYLGLSKAGILRPRDPHERGRKKKIFYLKDIPELTNRVFKPEKEILSEESLRKETSTPVSLDDIKDTFQKIVNERIRELEEKASMGESFRQRIDWLEVRMENFQREVREEIEKKIGEEIEVLSEKIEKRMVKFQAELAEAIRYTRETASFLQERAEKREGNSANRVASLMHQVIKLIIDSLEDLKVCLSAGKLLAERLSENEKEKRYFEELIQKIPPDFLEPS